MLPVAAKYERTLFRIKVKVKVTRLLTVVSFERTSLVVYMHSNFEVSILSPTVQREKEGNLTQPYDNPPPPPHTPTENSKTKGQHTHAIKNFDYTTIADRLRTVS